MFKPRFTITNEILKSIASIEAAREIIDNAPLIPAWEKKFKEEALVRTVHFGTHIEGNELSFTQAANVLEGKEVLARERDIQEVINYRNVLALIDRMGGGEHPSPKRYQEGEILKIHAQTCEKIIPGLKCGHYRQTQVVLRNSATGEIAFRPPPADQVPKLVRSFLDWLNGNGGQLHPVLQAGVTHYALAYIHPFVEGNGRTARAFATLILFKEGYDIKKLFSLEEYFDHDAAAYYQALQAVSGQKGGLEEKDLTPWLEYFTKGLAIELSRVKEKVKKLSFDSRLKGKLGRQIALTERQIKLVEYLEEYGEITTSVAREILPMISDDTLLRDLKDLEEKGIVVKKGVTKAAKYVMK